MIVNKKYEKLNEDDKKMIDKEKIINLFKNSSHKLTNSRQISNLIEEKINSVLIENFIGNEESG